MFLKNFDLFATQFQFNVGQNQVSKRSMIGAILSLVVICLSIAYFIYLLLLYLGNQIDPKYKSQTFISDESIKVQYHNEIVGFRYEYDFNKSVEELEQETGQKYLVYIPFLEIQKSNEIKRIPLEVIKCQRENLQGYNCIDFSNAPEETLENNNSENLYKMLMILVYRCTDIDIFKKTVPSNCASESDIVSMIGSYQARLRMKLYTSQYNTVSEQIQESYKNINLYINTDEFVMPRFKTMKQTTQIKKGSFIQQSTNFSSPIDYSFDQRIFNRQTTIEYTKLASQVYVVIQVGEQYQQIQIQYATFMEILAICNSTFAVLMGFGIIGRYFAKQLIKEDIQLLLLQNIFQQYYLKSLKKFKIFQNNIPEQVINSERQKDDVIENTQSVFIPSFLIKSKESVGLNNPNQQATPFDFIVEKKQTLQQINKGSGENITCGTEHNNNSERSKLNLVISNYGSQQSMIKDSQSKYKESQNTTRQKKNTQTDILLASLNQKDQIDRPSPKVNFKNQVKFDLYKKKSQSNMSSQKEIFQSMSSANSYAREYNQEQSIQQCFENLKAIQDQSFGTQMKSLLFKPKICNKQTNQMDPMLKKILDDEVSKSLDIVQIYKEIIFLKKAIMMILSKDQYAAIQLIGSSGTFNSQGMTQDAYNTDQFQTLITFQKYKQYKDKNRFELYRLIVRDIIISLNASLLNQCVFIKVLE